MTNHHSRGACASCFFVFFFTLLTACQPSVPVRQVYLPADCPAVHTPKPQSHVAHDTPSDALPPLATPASAPSPTRTTPTIHPPPAVETPSGLVDLNTATSAKLQTLPGIGPAMAKRIIDRRERRQFRRVRDLRRVRGIGPATFKRLKALVQVSKVAESKP